MDKVISGRCLCNQVRFQISSLRASAHCHCSYCRLSSGAAFVTWVVVPSENFQIVSGNDSINWYQSSPTVERGFCKTCGSNLFFKPAFAPGEIHVTLANLTSPVDISPKYHCFWDRKVDWVNLSDNLERLNSDSEKLSKYSTIPEYP